MSEFWFNDGTPRKARELYFNDGSVRKLKEAWFNDGTSVRKVYSGVGSPALTAHTLSGISAAVNFRNDGTLNLVDDFNVITAGQWLTSSPTTVLSTDSAAWDVIFTYVSGPNPTSGTANTGIVAKHGDAYGTALNLSTTRSISLVGTTGLISGSYGGSLRFTADIHPTGSGTILASATFTLNIASA